MSVKNLHPQYKARVPEWKLVRDGLEGHGRIKSEGQEYLPAPPGMQGAANELLASTGKRTTQGPYDFYLSFAEFPELLDPTLSGFQGLIHSKSPTLELPDKLQYLTDRASPDSLTLEVLWQEVTREILSGGRVELLADVDPKNGEIVLALYRAEGLINWRVDSPAGGGTPGFVVLSERSEVPDEDDEFAVKTVEVFRELRVIDGVYRHRKWVAKDGNDEARPVVGAGTDGNGWTAVSSIGRKFSEIPITVINALDVGYGYGAIPMMPLARRCLSMYRLSADYRRAIYLKCDPQTCMAGVKDGEKPTSIGGTTVWRFSDPKAKAWYLDVDGQGIPLTRQAIEDEKRWYDEESGRLLSAGQRQESGDALRERREANQLTLKNIVINAARGFQSALRKIAKAVDVPEESVVFKPNLDFVEPLMTGKDLLELVQAMNAGAPMAPHTIHENMVKGGLTKLTWDDEIEKIAEEVPGLLGAGKPPVDGDDEGEPDDVTDDDEGDGADGE